MVAITETGELDSFEKKVRFLRSASLNKIEILNSVTNIVKKTRKNQGEAYYPLKHKLFT